MTSPTTKEYKIPLIGAIDQISRKITEDISSKQHQRSTKADNSRRKLFVKDSGVVKVIPFDDIDWVDAAGDYMCVHAKGETHIIRITLGELIDKLDENLFVRIHRSTIVNIERVVSIAALPKGGSLLELTSGTSLKVESKLQRICSKFLPIKQKNILLIPIYRSSSTCYLSNYSTFDCLMKSLRYYN